MATWTDRNLWLPATGTTTSPSTRREQNAETTARSRWRSSFVLPTSTRYPRRMASSSTARATADQNVLATSSTTSPTVAVTWRLVRRWRAISLRW
jgi:hypothetical protein